MNTNIQTLAVGCAAGFSGDRTDAAAPVVRTLIARGGPCALIFENLAERTLAQQQLAKRANPQLGYEPLLEQELRPILKDCLAHASAPMWPPKVGKSASSPTNRAFGAASRKALAE